LQRANADARAFWFSEPTNDKVLSLCAFRFLPIVGPLTGAIRRVAALADDALGTEATRALEHFRTFRNKVLGVSNRAVRFPNEHF
jgi:hypothetical protein